MPSCRFNVVDNESVTNVTNPSYDYNRQAKSTVQALEITPPCFHSIAIIDVKYNPQTQRTRAKRANNMGTATRIDHRSSPLTTPRWIACSRTKSGETKSTLATLIRQTFSGRATLPSSPGSRFPFSA